MLVSQLTEDRLTDEMIDRLLYEGLEDRGKHADCIVVLGSEKAVQYRVPVAAELYHAGRAGKIMMCGGTLRTVEAENQKQITEAEHMRQRALQLGVPDEAILLEDASQNTIENILYSLVVLQRSFWLNRVQRVLLVTNACHMRRSLHIARYLYPAHIAVDPCPAQDANTRRSNWMHHPLGTERARAEAANLIRCVKNGVFPDFEI